MTNENLEMRLGGLKFHRYLLRTWRKKYADNTGTTYLVTVSKSKSREGYWLFTAKASGYQKRVITNNLPRIQNEIQQVENGYYY